MMGQAVFTPGSHPICAHGTLYHDTWYMVSVLMLGEHALQGNLMGLDTCQTSDLSFSVLECLFLYAFEHIVSFFTFKKEFQ